MRRLLLPLFLLSAFASAQTNRFPPINLYAGDPTGNACTGSLIQQSSTTGFLYTCQSGVMKDSSAGTGNPGGSNLQLQFNNSGAFGGATGIFTDSASKSLLYALANIGSGPPEIDARHFSFAGGLVADGATDNGAVIQAAWNTVPSAGGRILLTCGTTLATACYWDNPTTFNWGSHIGLTTLLIQGFLRVGTTLNTPPGVKINIECQNGTSGAQFQGPGGTCTLFERPTTNLQILGTLNTTFTPTFTGAGSPTASLPVVCDQTTTGDTYQDTNQVNAVFWTCSKTTGTGTSGTGTLTVAASGGFVKGDIVAIAGVTGTYTISSITGTSWAVTPNLTSSPSGAAVTLNQTYSGLAITSSISGWVQGAVETITPSSMAGIFGNKQGTALGLAGPLSCSIAAISRVSNVVTATFSGACHIGANAAVTVAGVTDSTFNGAHTNGVSQGPWQITNADYVTNTLTWKDTVVGTASSSGGTVTGLNQDNIETILVGDSTVSTFTARFYRPHASTDQFGAVGLYMNSNGVTNRIKDLTVTADGPGIAMPQMYKTVLENVGNTSSGPCAGNLTQFSVDISLSNYIYFKGVGLNTTCYPFSIHQSTPYNIGYASNGPLYIDDSLTSGGIYLDYGGMGVIARNNICEQCARGYASFDDTHYYSGVPQNFVLDNITFQDNPAGLSTCALYSIYPQVAVAGTVNNMSGYTACVRNDYYNGSLKSGGNVAPVFSLNSPTGPYGTVQGSGGQEAENRGEQAGFGPSIIPFATENIDQSGSTWTGTCTRATGVLGPDGSTNAVSLSAANNTLELFGFKLITPVVGDMILFGAWVYSPTAGTRAIVSGTAAALTVDNNSSTHYQVGNNTNGLSNSSTTQYDLGMINDWWHPLSGFTTITSSDGTINQTLRFGGGCNSTNTISYFKPWMIYVPLSAGIPQAEVLRWRQQLLHGIVPPNMPGGLGILAMDPAHKIYWGSDTNIYRGAAGVVKTDGIMNAVGGFQHNGSALKTTDLGDWTNSTATTSSFAKCNSVDGGGNCTSWAPGTAAGAGNVSGPGSAVNTDCASFNGTTGTTIQDSGIPCINLSRYVAKVNQTALTANVATIAAYAIPASAAGWYEVNCYTVLTTAATTSSTLPSCGMQWTDADTGVSAKTTTGGASPQLSASSTQNIVSTTGMVTGSGTTGPMNGLRVHAAASSNINYFTASYASVGATPMQYAVHVMVEYLGP